jgi:hypothetical protein
MIKIAILGYQDAALRNLIKGLSYFLKCKISFYNSFSFSQLITDKKVDLTNKSKLNLIINKDKRLLEKISKFNNIIIGTSEKVLESNIANYYNKIKVNFYSYLDSNVNIILRYKNYLELPKRIICFNYLTIKQIKKEILKNKNIYNLNILNLNMPFQHMLKKKYSNIIRYEKIVLYLSSDLGLEIENKNILFLYNSLKINKFIYISVHPREKIDKWIKYFENFKKIKIFQNKEFYNNNNIKNVYGVSTMGLINYKFAGFKVFYFDTIQSAQDPFKSMLIKYKIKKIPLNK